MTRGIKTLPEPMQRLALRLQPEGGRNKKTLLRKLDRAFAKAREPQRLYGHRTQEMFKHLVSSLGAFKLIKDEDSGDVVAKGLDIKIPDFRVVLPDEKTWLIEVKNNYEHPNKPFSMTKDYFDAHLRYADLCGHQLRFAVYWGRINTWTLVPPTAFLRTGGKLKIDLTDAFTSNEMVYLGDKFLATGYPLAWHLDVKAEHVKETKTKTKTKNGNWFKFTILDASIRCRDRILKTALERELAYLFMFFGNWRCNGWRYVETEPGLGYTELSVEPPEEAQEDGDLAQIATLSSIFSAYYRQVTSGVKPKKVQKRFKPGMLGKLLTKKHDFKGSNLPLAVMEIFPKDFKGAIPGWL